VSDKMNCGLCTRYGNYSVFVAFEFRANGGKFKVLNSWVSDMCNKPLGWEFKKCTISHKNYMRVLISKDK